MKKLFFAFFLLYACGVSLLHAQPVGVFVANGTNVKIGPRDTLMVKGALINANHDEKLNIHNAGHIYLTGDLEDRGKGLFRSSSFCEKDADNFENLDSALIYIPASSTKLLFGHLHFVGSTPQTIRSATDTSIWLAYVHVENTVKLENSIRVMGVLSLNDSLDLNGNDIYHYISDEEGYTGNWGRLAGESNNTFVYDSRPDSAGALRMFKYKSSTEREDQFKDLTTMGLTIATTQNNAKISVARYHARDMGVTSGSIRKYFDVDKAKDLNTADRIGIHYFDRDFNPAEMSEADFSLFELQQGSSLPKARRLQSDLNAATNYISSTDSINYMQQKRYSVATIRCSNPPVIKLGPDTVVCAGSGLLLKAPVKEYLPVQYEWMRNLVPVKTGRNDSTLTVHEAGTYYVRVTDSRGCESIDSIKITEAPMPQPMIQADFIRRCESAPFTFTYADTSGATIAKLHWDFGDATSSADPVYTKSYDPVCNTYLVQLTVTSDKGCRATNSRQVEVEQRKRPQIRKDLHDLVSNFVGIDTLTGCNSDIATATWYVNGDSISTGLRLDNYVFPGYGDYIIGLRMRGTLCEAYAEDTVHIKAPGVPRFAHAAGKKDYCVGEAVQLQSTSEVHSGAFAYYWNFGNGRLSQDELPPAITYTAAGVYTVTLTMESKSIPGWQRTYSDTMRVHANPVINFGGAIFHCKAQYALHPQEAENMDYTYEWKSGASIVGNNYSYTASTDGAYTLTVTNSLYGCRSTEQVQLTLNNHLQPQLGADRENCGSITLDAHNPGATYLWNTGATSREITVMQSGSYHVYVSDAEGCEGRDTVTLTIHEMPDVSLGADAYLCDNETLTLQTPANAAEAVYLWSTGATTERITVASAGFYNVRVTHVNGVCSASDTIRIFQQQAPVITFDGSYYVCNGQGITLSQYNHYAADLIRWTYPDGQTATGAQITTNHGGVHSVYVHHANGCSATGSVTVGKGETNVVANFMVSSKANANDVLQMVNLSYPEPLTYTWEADGVLFSTDENPQLTLYSGASWMAKDTFYVRLTATDGSCPVSRTKQIIILPQGALMMKDPDTGEEVIIATNEDEEPEVDFTTNYRELLDASLYPNPTKIGHFTVEVQLTAPSPVQIAVFSLSGIIMDKKLVNVPTTSEQIQVSTAGYPPGFYLVHISAGKKTRLMKVIVNR